ncbi:MAG: maleylpyruvate isomerase N-terminal domain-containing protein [Vicinamibacterales bacterium]
MFPPPEPIPAGPIEALDALERVEGQLLELLGALSPEEWTAPTIVPGWQVRHVAGHLLDTATRKLSIVRDGHAVERPASGASDDVRAFVDRLNSEGVLVYGRLSRAVLLPLMGSVSREYCAFHRSLDPMAPAAFAVSWAGEHLSPNWFDTARELTERWHHQQQIRLATDRPGIMVRALYHPVLDCFMRVLPHTYRIVEATDGTSVRVQITGDSGGEWALIRHQGRWVLTRRAARAPATTVTIPEAMAWRLFTKGISRDAASRAVTVDGDRALAEPVFSATAIVG